MNKQKAINKFLHMRNMAELQALSNYSLERPLNKERYNRLIELKRVVGL